jgi:uncharacterized phage infection (PIP) family protein YhgE
MKTVTLANGKKVLLVGFGFNLNDVAEAIRPTPKVKANKFRRALPWILVAIFAIGLAVSGYFNWHQHQVVLEWESHAESLRNENSELYDYYSQSEDNNNDLRDQIYQLQQDRSELLDQLNKLADQLDEIRSQTADVNTRAYSLWYDLYYYDTAPDAYDLDSLATDADNLTDFLDGIISELDSFIYNFGW